jgi:hypothetical protein
MTAKGMCKVLQLSEVQFPKRSNGTYLIMHYTFAASCVCIVSPNMKQEQDITRLKKTLGGGTEVYRKNGRSMEHRRNL